MIEVKLFFFDKHSKKINQFEKHIVKARFKITKSKQSMNVSRNVRSQQEILNYGDGSLETIGWIVY